MWDIPSELLREILVWLPAEYLLRFRAVCKEWRRLIDDPSFVKSHTNFSNTNTLLIRIDCDGDDIDALYSLSLESLNFTDNRQTVDATPVKNSIFRCGSGYAVLEVCNGLVLISYSMENIWVIWNPLTQESHKLPQSPGSYNGSCIQGSGFGYDYAADDYKVVRINSLRRDGVPVHQTHMYSLKSDSWRIIRDCPHLISDPGEGVCQNGALHWMSDSEEPVIFGLDLGTEEYRQLSVPFTPITDGPYQVNLEVLGGCLFLNYKHGGSFDEWKRYDGWLMNEYGVEKSWTKLFSFVKQHLIDAWAVAYFKSKRHLLLQHTGGFFWFDIENDSVKKVTINGLSDIFSSQIFEGSLFRLRGNSRTEEEEETQEEEGRYKV